MPPFIRRTHILKTNNVTTGTGAGWCGMRWAFPSPAFPVAPSEATCLRCAELYEARGRPVASQKQRRTAPPPLLPYQPGDGCPVCRMGRMRFHDVADQRFLNCHVCTYEGEWLDAPAPMRGGRTTPSVPQSRDRFVYLRGLTHLRKAGYTLEDATAMSDDELRAVPRVGPEFIRVLRLRHGPRRPMGGPVVKVKPGVGLTERWVT